MFASILVYLGLVAAGAGAVSLLKPLAFLRIRRRLAALAVLGAGAAVAGLGLALPAREVRVAAIGSRLDEFVPAYQFDELHSIDLRASKSDAYRAIKAVTAEEITLFRALTWIRRLGRPGPASILNPPKDQPLLDVATQTSFLLLADDPDREIVVGTVIMAPRGWRPGSQPTAEDFKALRGPGFAPAAMNFSIQEVGTRHCTVTTETRVLATDATVSRRFAAYWRLIYPGSALIRRMWLRAIKHRAERQPLSDRK